MRRTVLLLLLAVSLKGFTQNELIAAKIETIKEMPGGAITGTVITTDNQPAAYVTVFLKGVNKTTTTDEQGTFTLKNVKEGTYSLEVLMVGLKTQEKTIEIRKDQMVTVTIALIEDAKQLEAVVVSNIKSLNSRPVSLGKAGLAPLDNPQAIGIVPQVVIRDQQASRLGDIIKNVSGVSLTQQRQGVAETFSARGYSIGIAGAGGSIFKNGVVSNTMGFPEASTLESVEVLKGSSALLYGNTSGGVIINMVTKKPKFNWGGEVSMRVGSYDFYKPTVDVYGPISKDLAFRVVGTYEKSNSFRDVVKNNRTYVNPSLLYKLGKKTTILLQGDYLDADFTPDNGIGILNQNIDPIIPASRSRFINTSWAYYKLKQASGFLNIDHAFTNNWKLNLIGSAQGTDVNSYATNVPMTVASNGDWSRALSRTKTSEDDYTLQLNLNGKFKTGFLNHQLLVGTDYVKVVTQSNGFRITSNGVVVSTYDKINVLDMTKYVQRTDIPDAENTTRTTSPSHRKGVYAQDLITITDKFKVLAGVRWSYQKVYQTTTDTLAKGTRSYGAAADKVDKAWSPKVALIYQPVKTTSIYASYTNNFNVNSGTDVYGAILSSSLTDQYEVGVKNELLKGKLSANVSLYRIVNHNLAQQALFKADGVTPNPDVNVRELTGETTSDGFEVDFNGTFSKNFYFITGYGYNYMRYTKTSGAKGAFVEGERLINNPAHTANAAVFYTFDGKAVKGLKVGAAAFYTGKRNGGLNNTIQQTPVYNRLIELGGFSTVDLSAGYTYRKVSLLAKLSNITNTLNYVVHDRYSVNPIPPRQVIATVSYKF